MSTGDNTDFSNLSGLFELHEAARQLFGAHVLTDEEHRTGRIAPADAAPQLTLVEPGQEAELKRYREAKGAELRAMMARLQLSPDLKAEIEGAIQSLDGASNKQAIDALAQTISHQIQDASQNTSSQVGINDLQAREQQLLAQWNAYKESRQAARDDFRNCGYGDTKENEEKLTKLWAKMETLEPGSAEWANTADEITKMDGAYFKRVKEEAMKRGDWETVRKAEEALKSTREAQDGLKEVIGERDEIAKEKQKNHGVGINSSSIFDDEPALTQAKPEQNPEGIAKIIVPKEETVELGHLSPTIVSNNTPSGGRGIG